MAVNFDPANLVMNGFDHLTAARELAAFIVHTHAKDGVRVNGTGQEMVLGQGAVDFPSYVRLLQDLGYDGVYTIERETGPDRVGDIRRAARYLQNIRVKQPV